MELYHHGVKGQKWGVRRSPEQLGNGVSSSKSRKFTTTEQNVRKHLTNSYTKFDKQKIDISTVKDRSGLNIEDAIKCSTLSTKKFKEASKLEPKITKDIVSAVSNSGGKMYGLEYRLKQPTSMAGKIGSDSKNKHISFDEAYKGIKDAIRYTAVSENKDFVKNYERIKQNLSKKGYTETRCKNYFDMYAKGESMHKAVQCVYKNKDGYEFELQFQTPSSQAAKELKLSIYEERRKSGISKQRALELESQMRNLAEQVQNPPGISTIKNK